MKYQYISYKIIFFFTCILFGINNLTVTEIDEIGLLENKAPVALDDVATVEKGSTVKINLILNDTDVDDDLDITSISIETGPAHGTVTIN
ncbi:MAG: Ig-like domain-containing protein [Proteobacteria bacterium]|nr:Ig-like domain-containing protein [Pseudomonadota bacterium]